MLKMLVTLTGYLTNTISSCQEFVESVATNMQMSYNSAGSKLFYILFLFILCRFKDRFLEKKNSSRKGITEKTVNKISN